MSLKLCPLLSLSHCNTLVQVVWRGGKGKAKGGQRRDGRRALFVSSKSMGNFCTYLVFGNQANSRGGQVMERKDTDRRFRTEPHPHLRWSTSLGLCVLLYKTRKSSKLDIYELGPLVLFKFQLAIVSLEKYHKQRMLIMSMITFGLPILSTLLIFFWER